MSPTVCYITARKNPRFTEWFLPGLARQAEAVGDSPLVIKIDRFAEEPHEFTHGPITVKVHPPKPSVWYGPHRLTDRDWFAASSFRNTALCLCATEHIAYCDDLSILHPEWWQAAKDSAEKHPQHVTCGLYSKIRDVVVQDGVLVSYTQPVSGIDNRVKLAGPAMEGPCNPRWMFGCSLVAPVEELLKAGGWPEMADGLSFEDCLMSTVMGNNGTQFRYDRRLFTWEDEAAHHEDPENIMVRRDKGVSPNDKSHAALRLAEQTKEWHNYYEGGTRALREHVLAGNPFPVVGIPENDWFDGQLISEMHTIL